ncbi:MAG: lysylphosphatidylglycerol synthase transmembrane domain-containing protein [Promethearchaeota archaeon]
MKDSFKKILVGMLTLILIVVMFIFVDIQNIIFNLKKISFLGLAFFSLIYSAVFLLRAFRLKLIFSALNINTPYFLIVGAFGIGWAINEITPGKIGDFIRIEVLHQKVHTLPLSKSTCGVVIERFIDLLILFSISSYALFYMYLNNIQGTTSINLQLPLIIGALIILGGIIFILLLFLKTRWVLNLISLFSKKLKNFLEKFLKNFLEGISDFRQNFKKSFLVIALSLPIWVLESFTLLLLFFLAGYKFNVFIIIISQIILFFSKTFPITPGGWILSENVGALIVFLFYPTMLYNNILSIFILDHIIRIAYILIYGLISSFFLNIKFKKLSLKPPEKQEI